jgi:hypothetical protein
MPVATDTDAVEEPKSTAVGEQSAGFIVPLEGLGPQNPARGKGPCFRHGVQRR